ncbi:uncharacterized protein LOC116833646 isoform X2 [Chelonoidis abingdonii]|uniref:uncharacterized protein LOC116833646 isoform X2 n=1 Tax=Chelonoidis abingdonii TaxID=106734 RepID=UPI0013F2916D|nr:uncharacterized protein LOC116833646 isoform X2 [Chelonoidis abingdonii]
MFHNMQKEKKDDPVLGHSLGELELIHLLHHNFCVTLDKSLKPRSSKVFCAKLHKTSEERRRHSLDVQRALAFYLEHTKPFCKSIQLFIATADKMKGHPVSSQRISNWITSWIRTPCNTSRRTLVTEKHFPASEAHPPKGLMVGSDSDHVPRNIYQTHGY